MPHTFQFTRRGWVLLVICPAVVAVLWLAVKLITRWEVMEKQGVSTTWRKGNVLHLDANGDGRVDQEMQLAEPPNYTRVKRDSDFDGWYDMEYEIGPYGIAIKLRQICEQAPRH